jgi:hypothetical protein
VKPEDIERLLAEDAARVVASLRFSARVMAAVQREAEMPLPIPFPWRRAWPGIVAGMVAIGGGWVAASREEAPDATFAAVGVARAAEVVARIGDAFASVDPVWLVIGVSVAALTLLPVAAPFWLVSYRRGS